MSLIQRLQNLLPTIQIVPATPKSEKVMCQGSWLNDPCKSVPVTKCTECQKPLCEDCRFLNGNDHWYCYWCEFDISE